MAVAGGEELPTAFQKDCWGDDDEYECEEEDDSQNASWGSRLIARSYISRHDTSRR